MAKNKPIPAKAAESNRLDHADNFEQVLLTYWEPICRALTRLTGDLSQAEDITLETFWRFWQHPPASTLNVKAWLYRVAVNLGYNTIRSSRRRLVHETNAGKTTLQDQFPANPEAEFDHNQEREQVRITLSRMKPREAKILILRHSGQAYHQIAEILNISTSSVGTTLLRAEKRFRQLYEKTGKNQDAPKRENP